MPEDKIFEKILNLEKKITQLEHRLSALEHAKRKAAPIRRTMLPTAEAARYLGIEVGTLQQMACRREIEHFKPGGKLLYFEIKTLNAWLKRNKQATSKV